MKFRHILLYRAQKLLAFWLCPCYDIVAVFPASTQGRGIIREFETILT